MPAVLVPPVARREQGGAARQIISFIRLAAARIGVWSERVRQRRALARLDDRLLDDIGVTRELAQYEIRKPFWLP